MRFIGIDLGTTNSAICSYDGAEVHLYKSPDQNDVTPSAIFIDRRGNRFLGKRAYDSAAKNPDNAATKFKRMIGTSTPIRLAAVDITLTPEECSAEILKLCFGYLPEDIRNSGETGTVITVPAAFNQMQKDATLAAAEMAGLGRVALMQEPVAAVMAVMRQRKTDGIFLVFDLGGGTLDVALAENIGGRVSLLAHGGVSMCGGTDFDRNILDHIVKPHLLSQFKLPEDLSINPKYKALLRTCLWASEKAKIELSSREETTISVTESDITITDEAGNEIYVDIPFDRAALNDLMAAKFEEAIACARETLEKSGLSPSDVDRIVFVGGPTQYKPLRDKVSFELGIAPSTDVNPMTAVAEGAAVFAESIDWASQSRGRKTSRGSLGTGGAIDLSFNFIARTPETRAKIVAKLGGDLVVGAEFQIDSLDTGWSSGRVALKNGAFLDLNLPKPGENLFKVFVFDANGGAISLPQDKIIITRTAASVDAIPASHSIGIEARDKIGGRPTLAYLVRDGDQLPKKGKLTFRAEETLKAGSPDSLKFKLWEGEIQDPITDNRFIGTFELYGTDFTEGVIPAGAELVCDFEVLDSGTIKLEVTAACIGGSFNSARNYYSGQAGHIDYTNASRSIRENAQKMLDRLAELSATVTDERLTQAKDRAQRAHQVRDGETDPDLAKQAMDDVQDAKRLLSIARKDHLPTIREIELENVIRMFDDVVREYAKPSEASAFDNLVRTARRSIEQKTGDFESHLSDLKQRNFEILFRVDWFIVQRFRHFCESDHLFPDSRQHAHYAATGEEAIKANDIEALRVILYEMEKLRIDWSDDDDMIAAANIVMG